MKINGYRDELNVKVGDTVKAYLGCNEYYTGIVTGFSGERTRISCAYIVLDNDRTLPENSIVELIKEA